MARSTSSGRHQLRRVSWIAGRPANHTIVARTACRCSEPGYVAYQEQVLANSRVDGQRLTKKGYALVSGGTDNHWYLVDLKNQEDRRRPREAVLEKANIALNKNTIPGDKSALSPGGVRMGAPALTSRGFDEADFETVVDLFDRGVQIALDVKAQGGKLKDFRQKITEGENAAAIEALKKDVSAFASGFPQVGVPDA